MLPGLFRAMHRQNCDWFAGIPGPDPDFLLGNAWDFLTGWPWERCADYARRFGGLTLAWMGSQPALVLNDPDLIGEVLVDHWQDFYKDAPVEALRPVITSGSLFITNAGHGWEQARAQNPLTTVDLDRWLVQQVEPLHTVISECVRSWIARSPREPIDLYRDMQRLMFDAFARAFWGRTLDADRFDWFQTMADYGSRRMNNPLWLYLPCLSPSFSAARRNWYDSFEALVRDARSAPDATAVDLLHVALGRGTEPTDAALAEALATNFFGGVFSGSSTVNTALYLLAKHPHELADLTAALRRELGTDGRWDRAKLEACRPLDFVVREAMRYYPAVPIYFRNSAKDGTVRLGPHTLPPNTLLFISNWHLHRFSKHWTQPEDFRPDRWSNGVAEANPLGSGHFFPFGRGPRACIGMPFGVFAIKLALATILLESDVRLDAAQPYTQSFFFGVMMPKGLKATFAVRA